MGVFNAIIGTSGPDTLNGTSADDFILANEGNDIVFGFDGNDSLLGNQQNDEIAGNNGDDTLFGGKNNDALFGDQGSDSLFGNKGNDRIFGGQGNDTLFGGEDNDELFGDLGNDVLFGDLGSDTLQGGGGRDKFVLALRGDGAATSGGPTLADADLIIGFEDGQDQIGLSNLSFDQLIIEGDGSNTVIRVELQGLGNQFLAILEGIDVSLITAEDFTTDLSAIVGDPPTPPTPLPPIPIIPPTPDRPDPPVVPPTPPNQAPIALNDFAQTFEGVGISIDVLGNDADPEGEAISISEFAATSANGGAIVRDGDTLRYTPVPGFIGQDTFTYTVTDPEGLTDAATVTVTVNERDNTPPVATDDFRTTFEDSPVSINVISNDTDADDDPLNVSEFQATSANNGSISRVGNNLVYTPAPDFTGTDTFSYTIIDGRGGADAATVSVNVLPVVENTPPVANPDGAITNIETPVNINVLANDFDADGDQISISGFPTTTGNGGTIAQNGNVLQYTPGAGFVGGDSFVYTISDGTDIDTATVTVNVIRPNNDPEPIEDPQTEFDTEFGTSLTISILDNFVDPDGDPLSILFAETTEFGGTIALVNGSLEYTPASGFSGNDTFIYTVSDSQGGFFPVQVTITVEQEINQPPVAVADIATTPVDTVVAIDVLGNDFDIDGPDEALEIVDFATASEFGGTIVEVDGQLQYTPAAGFTGTDTFGYTIDDVPGDTASATVTVIVEPPDNNAPIPEDDAATTIQNTNVEIDVLINDTDPDDDAVLLVDFQATTSEGGTVTRDQNGTPFNRTDDVLVYSPATDFTGEDSFIYTVGDGNGGFAVATVSVTVIDGNVDPTAVEDSATTDENLSVEIDVLANDFDEDGDPVLLVDTDLISANGGTIALIDVNGTPFDTTDDNLVYTPASGFTGSDTFSYTISDGQGGSDSTTVTVAVLPTVPPIAEDDVAETANNQTVTIAVLANDSDPEGETVSLQEFQEISDFGGTVTRDLNLTPFNFADDLLIYEPPADFVGTDTFDYTIVDERGLTATATVTVNVIDGNNPPVAVDDLATTNAGVVVDIPVLDNDFDIDDDIISLTDFAATASEGGTVVRNNNGTPLDLSDDFLEYTPADGFTGPDTFTYTISDGIDTATAEVTVTVEPIIEPDALPDTATVAAGMNVEIDVLENDFDPQGETIVLAAFQATTQEGGTVVRLPNGTPEADDDTLLYSPAEGFIGTDRFFYLISNESGGTDVAGVTVTVIGQASEAFDDLNVIVRQGAASFIPVLANDISGEGVDLRVIAVDGATSGTLAISADEQSVIYTPNAGFTGPDTFTYTFEDSNGFTSTATVELTVQVEIVDRLLQGDIGAEQIVGDNELVFSDPTIGNSETLDGGAGNDSIIGRDGSDILVGGAGADDFLYFSLSESGQDPNLPLEPGDTIIDFNVVEDEIGLLFEVGGAPVTDADIAIGLSAIDTGVASIRILDTTFQIRLTNLESDTTEEQIRGQIFFES